MVQSATRDVTVDVAKGLCILLVVCIHAEVFGYVPMPFTFIAVPMFFFMSGFFDHTEMPLNRIAKRNLRSLLLPAAIWTVVGVGYLTLLTLLKGDQPTYTFDPMNPCSGNGPCWFLVALVWVKLFSWLFDHLRLNAYVAIVVSLVIGYIGINRQMPFYLDEGCAALPLYLVGKRLYPCRNRRGHWGG